jgi:hypothetical protein
MGFHANNKDFWAWLIDEKGTQNFRDDVARLIVFSQVDSYRDQRQWERNFLAEWGLRVKGETPEHIPFDMTLKPEERAHIIATVIAPEARLRHGYRSIGLYQAGHAMAAWVAQDVLFFDPSWDEYWFETRAGFRGWFKQYWKLTARGATTAVGHKFWDITYY